jgi:hypothetical protein
MKQIQEYSALGLSYSDYWNYRDDIIAITKRAEEEGASNDDVIKAKYIDSVNSKLSDIKKEKEEVLEDESLSAKEKEAKTSELDKQFNELAKERYNSYNKISFDGDYANIGSNYYQWYTPKSGESYWRKLDDDQVTKYKVTSAAGNTSYATNGKVHYRLNEGGDWRNISDWTKISDKDLARQKEVTKELGITPEEYWGNTDVAYHPVKTGEYEYAYDNPETYAVAKAVGGYDAYKNYSEYLFNYQSDKYIGSDKDANGKSISNSRKPKVVAYINGLNIDYGEKLILYKSVYNGDDTYNYEIINYLNNRDDLSYDDMVNILTKLSFKVDEKGNISWD